MKRILLSLLLIQVCTIFIAVGQKQLVFVYRGSVMARYAEGDNFRFKLKSGKKVDGFIVELNDVSMVTSKDTIQFLSIEKVHVLRKVNVTKGIGGLLFLGGVGYIAVDQLNVALGYNKAGFDDSDWRGLIVGGVGAAILFVKPKYQKLKPGTSIRAIDYKSPYYKSPE